MSGRCDDEDGCVLPFPDVRNAATGERVAMRLADDGPATVTRLRPGPAIEQAIADLVGNIRAMGVACAEVEDERRRLADALAALTKRAEQVARWQFILADDVARLCLRLGLEHPAAPASEPKDDGA